MCLFASCSVKITVFDLKINRFYRLHCTSNIYSVLLLTMNHFNKLPHCHLVCDCIAWIHKSSVNTELFKFSHFSFHLSLAGFSILHIVEILTGN